MATDGRGVPLDAGLGRGQPSRLATAGPARRYHPRGPTLTEQVTVHLGAGYNSAVTRALLDGLALHGEIARKGVPQRA